MKLTTVSIDLAKTVFQLHGVDDRGKTVLKKQLKREQVAPFFAQLEPCLIGMEACGSAHYWARKLQSFGHTVKLMAPLFVKPYVKSNKNDMADAEAICEAVTRPNMRFVRELVPLATGCSCTFKKCVDTYAAMVLDQATSLSPVPPSSQASQLPHFDLC